MKPVSIEITAFGPYVTRQFVDFTKFHGDGLFLIRGNTGSGKTTILDAMCFALYGKLPGARSRSVVQLDKDVPLQVRPAAADDADPTKVVFVVDIADRRYRFTRVPAFRKSGGALAPHRAVVEEEIDGVWQPRLTRIDEIGQFSRDYVGLDVDQFAQLILLPQGEFATFLRANFKEREEILQTLFPLQVYADIERWFIDQRKTAGEALDNALIAQASAWVQLRTVAEDEEAEQPDDVAAWVDVVLAEFRDAMGRAQAEADAAASAAERVGEQINTAEASNESLRRYREAVAALEAADAALSGLERRVADDAIQRPYSVSVPPVVAALTQRADELDTRIADATALVRASENLAAAQSAQVAAQAAQAAQAARVAEAAGAVAETRHAYEALDSVAVDAQKAATTLEKLNDHLELLTEHDSAQQALIKAQDTAAKADAALAKAEKAVTAEGAKLNRSAAAELAELLVEDEPCMVCGSHEHPKPARAPRTAGDAEAYSELLEAAQLAEQSAAHARQQVAVAQADATRLSAKVVRSKLGSDAEVLAVSIGAAEEALQQANDKVKQREKAKNAVTQAESAHIDAQRTLETLRAAAQEASTLVAGLEAVVQQLAIRVPTGFDLAAASAEQSALRSRAQSLRAVLTDARAAEETRTAASAVRDEFAAAAGQAQVEIEPLRHKLAAERARQQAALNLVEKCRSAQERVQTAQRKFEHEAVKVTHASTEADLWRGISTYVEGNAGRKIPLTRFYLAQRLAQVAAAATSRLRAMSGGRYELVHDDSVRARHGAQGGLALLVHDNENACTRGPETLSGGETFMASLSLALGLSDVVTAEAGGVRLDSLFIDEGFGSLDADTLEEVLDVLEGLREHNRLVGVVSHVETLKERIPAQLLVQAGPNGSVIRHIAT